MYMAHIHSNLHRDSAHECVYNSKLLRRRTAAKDAEVTVLVLGLTHNSKNNDDGNGQGGNVDSSCSLSLSLSL
eukprot:COSAG03_NODE_2129_length_3093_cov_5.664329_1_plen_72_part_10